MVVRAITYPILSRMASGSDAVLFEAVSTPPQSFSRRGFRALAALLVLAASIPSLVFLWLGAWPVLGFLGGEVMLVLVLVARHARWSGRMVETVLLTEGSLIVTHTDRRGRRQEVSLEPYWTRVALRDDPGRAGDLVLSQHGRRVAIGLHLAAEEKRELAAALDNALRRYRTPVFDNPQLRDG